MIPPIGPKTPVKVSCVSVLELPLAIHSPDTKIESPVKLQIIIVSIKVPVIEINPCSTGSLVFAAAAAIGADPRPDSLEKTPRATPFWMAILTVAPANPPMAAVPVKAPERTAFKAGSN